MGANITSDSIVVIVDHDSKILSEPQIGPE